VDQDCFGIDAEHAQAAVTALSPAGKHRFAFTVSDRKLEGFMDWLLREQRRRILEVVEGEPMAASGAWFSKYIQRAYGQGITGTRARLRKARYDIEAKAGTMGGIRATIGGPVHAERIALLYGRTYEQLKSVIDAASGQARQRLADGLRRGIAEGFALGKSPREVARSLAHNVIDRLDKIGRSRLEMIARTEVARAQHVAGVTECERISKDLLVDIEAEWLTAGFGVCDICQQMEAEGPYSLQAVYDMIPAHPN
jgi:hypothetical protein